MTRKLSSAILLLLSTVCALVLAEVGLRLLMSSDDYYVRPPNLRMVFRPAQDVMPGMNDESNYSINASGVRGRLFSETDRYRILAIGGSTTEDAYLDDTETWTYLAEQELNDGFDGSPVWIGNVGRSGHNTRHHVLQAEKLLDQYPKIDLVILLVGGNDMERRLILDTDYRPMSEEPAAYAALLMDQAFAIHPGFDKNYPLLKRTEIYRTLRAAALAVFSPPQGFLQDEAGDYYVHLRNERRNAAHIREDLPESSASLNEYVQNLHTIIDLAQVRGAQILLMTQPTMWRDDLPKELTDLLWFGGVGTGETREEFYSIDALSDAMQIYNSALLEVCDQRSIDCLDLATTIPKDDTAFFDDVHFNESGARMVAAQLVKHLLDAKLLDK